MADRDKKGHHAEPTKDAYADTDEVSQEAIDRTVSEIEGGGPGERADAPDDTSSKGHHSASARKDDHRARHDPAEELKKAREEAKESYDRYLRSVAELDNFKKRMTKETEEYRKYANEELIKALLPSVDNLERALAHGEGNSDPAALLEGVRMVHKQLMDTLEKFGVERIASLGKPFDPNFHQALMQVKTNESPPNTVVTEVTKGYILNGRLIRPAMVGVSVRESGGDPTESPWGNEEFGEGEEVPERKDGNTIDDTE
jgi:molecular chaperone GrpE